MPVAHEVVQAAQVIFGHAPQSALHVVQVSDAWQILSPQTGVCTGMEQLDTPSPV
ncbi:MAG TPA: hypothetical protein VK745_29555 [Polyangiaceae bacterium]|nr:hypothetical protein [Polyangiaceae bacterium]